MHFHRLFVACHPVGYGAYARIEQLGRWKAAPDGNGRLRVPGLRVLWTVFMAWTRVEIPQSLIRHTIKFCAVFDDQPFGVEVIHRYVVPTPVAKRTPENFHLFARQCVTR